MNTLPDPHHPDIEWKFDGRKFYQKLIYSKNWTEVKRPHLTPQRVETLARLIAMYKSTSSF